MDTQSEQEIQVAAKRGRIIFLAAFSLLSMACSPFKPADPTTLKTPSSTTSLLPDAQTFPLETPTPTPGPGATPTPSPNPSATPAANSYTLTELAPYSAQFTNVSIASLPQGAIWNAQAGTLYWLPQRGQAGSYTISVTIGSSTTPTSINLTVNPAANLQQGPPNIYRDGTVGFVFVHGLSSENYCINQTELANYWGLTPEILSPRADLRTLSCYDGTRAVEQSALIVAQQILGASCGPYGKCIVVAHSMGNLIMEYILTHDRQALGTDPEPALFANASLFAQVKKKLLFVISLASAAGGSKVATILNDPNRASVLQSVAGELAGFLGQNTPATQSLTIQRASNVLAPFNADPGIPFFMVAGYTTKTSNEAGLIDVILGQIPQTVYNGDDRYAKLDPVVRFSSRSDGMVDFRSACGLASDAENAGPGYPAALGHHLNYCSQSQRKPNHFLWFVTNLNHGLITAPYSGCYNSSNPCMSWFTDATGTLLQFDGNFLAKSSVEVIRAKLLQ